MWHGTYPFGTHRQSSICFVGFRKCRKIWRKTSRLFMRGLVGRRTRDGSDPLRRYMSSESHIIRRVVELTQYEYYRRLPWHAWLRSRPSLHHGSNNFVPSNATADTSGIASNVPWSTGNPRTSMAEMTPPNRNRCSACISAHRFCLRSALNSQELWPFRRRSLDLNTALCSVRRYRRV